MRRMTPMTNLAIGAAAGIAAAFFIPFIRNAVCRAAQQSQGS